MQVTKKVKDLDTHIQRVARKATSAPVFTRVAKKPFKDKETVAQLKKYKPTKKGLPPQYEVVFAPQFVKSMQTKTLQKVASHELAHIKYPDVHTPDFKKEAIRLGAGNRSGAVGVSKY
jgi:hypothetical protein